MTLTGIHGHCLSGHSGVDSGGTTFFWLLACRMDTALSVPFLRPVSLSLRGAGDEPRLPEEQGTQLSPPALGSAACLPTPAGSITWQTGLSPETGGRRVSALFLYDNRCKLMFCLCLPR